MIMIWLSYAERSARTGGAAGRSDGARSPDRTDRSTPRESFRSKRNISAARMLRREARGVCRPIAGVLARLACRGAGRPHCRRLTALAMRGREVVVMAQPPVEVERKWLVHAPPRFASPPREGM